ncbi:MAG: hypothetical protein U0636_11835 [Phycisphaerales bacterium]
MDSTAGQSLTINTGGVTGFAGGVSGLGSLTTNAAGSNAINCSISTLGNLALGGSSTLGQPASR